MADWTALPRDLIQLIGNKLMGLEDFLVLSAVCRSWKSAARKEHWSPKIGSQAPWLMLPEREKEEDDEDTKREFFNLHKNKSYYLNLPETRERRCWGSPYGWIVTIDLDLEIHLFNPLTSRRIPLPPTTALQEEVVLGRPCPPTAFWMRSIFIDRAILVWWKNIDDFLLVAILCEGQVAVARPRDNTWLTLVCSFDFVADFVYFNGQVYAVCNLGRLAVIRDIDGPIPPKAVEIAPPRDDLLDNNGDTEKVYLVESSGELLMVIRYRDAFGENTDVYYRTYGFDVYKFDFDTKQQWVKKDEGLGNCALFVGYNCSFSVAPADVVNCRGNCIYFTDDNQIQWELNGNEDSGKHVLGIGGHDMGVYDLDAETVTPHYQGDNSTSPYQAPFWFIPNPSS